MKQKILFRADGNSATGLGHLYRLFSLVEMLKETFDFVFLTSEESTLSIIPEAYHLKTIPKAISVALEPKWLESKYTPKNHLIIADGYQFNSSYQKEIKKAGFTLVYIDDLLTQHMYADLVINHSPNITANDYKSEDYTQFALGTDYAMLRPGFLKQAKKKKILTKIDKVFINFGGADAFNLSEKYCKVVLNIPQIKQIHLVLGAAANSKKIERLQLKFPNKITIYRNLSEAELIKVMTSCNFAIVPCSTILFELFCVKMPIYSGYFVNNQKKAFFSFKKLNLIGGDGNLKYLAQSKLINKIEAFINSNKHQKSIDKQQQFIDGNQKERLTKRISDL